MAEVGCTAADEDNLNGDVTKADGAGSASGTGATVAGAAITGSTIMGVVTIDDTVVATVVGTTGTSSSGKGDFRDAVTVRGI